MDDSPTENLLTFKIDNRRPVALEDFANSVRAFGRIYEEYIVSSTDLTATDGVRFYVEKLKTGSLIAVLKSVAQQADFILHHVEAITPFLTQFHELVQFFSGLKSLADLQKEPTRKDAENVLKVFEPTAKDNGSSLALQFNGPTTIGKMIVYNSQEANAAQNGARRFLGPSVPTDGTHHDEVLLLHQVRDATKTETGDKGIIETFSKSPVKLLFSSDAIKAAILGMSENPFQLAFIVDVTVRTASGGKPALYKVLSVKDSFERPH